MPLRLDELLVRRGTFASRAKARAAVLAGDVRVDGRPVDKAGMAVAEEVEVEVVRRRRFVSRGGDKLAHALDVMGIEVAGEYACDLGSSTGGFIDCLLQRGVARVIAVDVGYGQLDWSLRQHPGVHVLERTNARDLSRECLPFAPTFVTADLSFISLTLALGPVLECARPGYRGLALVKPQFEAGRDKVGKGGVVRDPAVHRAVLERVAVWLERRGTAILGFCDSGHPGPKGNVEFFVWFCDGGAEPAAARVDPAAAAARAVEAVHG